MRSARQLSNEILVERHAEHGLLRYVNGINKVHIAIANSLPLTCSVIDREGNRVELHLNNFNIKMWDKYHRQCSTPIELGILTNNFIPVVCDMSRWLLAGGYSERYTYAKSRSARKFIRTGCFLLLAFYFMQHKYAQHEFIDTWVESQVGIINNARLYAEEVHKATGHAVKNKEDVVEAQERIYQKYISILIARNYIPYEPLPPLPSGTPDPLAMPEDEEEEENE